VDDPVHVQLERILASDGFVNAERLSRFLRFIVERTLDGHADGLKEYAVGIEVFDRDASYDPRIDSIVRVEARRLRSKLAEYYASSAGATELVIGLRKGTYVPYFEPRASEPLPHPAAAIAVDSGRHPERFGVRRVLAIAAAFAVIGVLVWLAWPPAASSRLTASAETTSIAVLPFAHYSTAEADRLLAGRVTDSLTVALAKFQLLSVRSRTSAMQFAGGRPGLAEVATRLNVRFVVEGSVRTTDTGVHLDARLVDVTQDRKVWTTELITTEPLIDATVEHVAGTVTDELLRRAGRQPSAQR
jgi:adenylate cyclase